MGKNITLVGDNGAGQTCKVANQIIVALNIEAVGEALLFAARSGADPERVRQALMGGFAASRILEVHGARMTKRTFDPGFRIELHQKDLNLALDGARKLASRCRIRPARSSCSACVRRTAARHGITRHSCARSRSCRTSRSARRRPRNTAATMRVLLRWRTRATDTRDRHGRSHRCATRSRITAPRPALPMACGTGEKRRSGLRAAWWGPQRHPATPGKPWSVRRRRRVSACRISRITFLYVQACDFSCNRRHERLHFRHAFRENRRASVHLR